MTLKISCIRLCEVLDGKGGGKGARFNAKINSFKKIDEVESVINQLVNTSIN